MKNPLKIIFILIFISSCSSTLDFHTPTQNFVSPEVVGDTLGVRLQATYTNSTKFELAKLEVSTIFDSSVSVSTDRGSTKDNVLNATAALGLGNAFEVTYRSYSDSPDLLGIKAQIIGRDGGQRKEGLKLSIYGGYGSAETDNDVLNATSLDGSSSRTYNSTLDVETFEIGSVLGYRLNDKFLPYLALAMRTSDAEGVLDSTSLSSVTIANKAKIHSAQVGFQLNYDNSYLLFEGGYSKSKWGSATAEEDYTLGLALGAAVP